VGALGVLLLLPVLLLLSVVAVAPVHAAEVEPLEQLLQGQADGEWQAALLAMYERGPAYIGETLGEVFRERDKYARNWPAVAYAAAYLANNRLNDDVLLASEILRRCYADTDFLARMRSHLIPGRGGWERLLATARAGLASPDAAVRRQSIWLLSQDDGPEAQRVVWDLWERARADLPSLRQGNGSGEALASEYLDAFYRRLGYRFPTVEDAVARLEGKRDWDLTALVLWLSLLKDSQEAPVRQKLLEWGKRLVDEAVQKAEPARLKEFVDPSLTNLPELRLYALQQAARLTPRPDAAWTEIFCTVLSSERDPRGLRQGLALLEKMTFGDGDADAARIAACALARLKGHDPLDDRLRLAKVLGLLRVRSAVLEALQPDFGALDLEVRAELVRALGMVAGARASDVLRYYQEAPGGGAADQKKLRVAAADALARRGMVQSDPAGAAAALRAMLTGQADLPKAEDADVRQQAIRSLDRYPGAETAAVLAALALAGEMQQAQAALVVLEGHLRRQPAADHEPAIRELAGLATNTDAPKDVRARSLQALAQVPAGVDPGLRQVVRDAARSVLSSDVPADLRVLAAQTSAALADPEALGPMFQFWSEGPGAERDKALRALLAAVAGAGDASDALIQDVVLRVGQAGAWDLAVQTARALVEASPRLPLRILAAETLLGRSGVEARPAAERRADLEGADALARAAFEGANGPPRGRLLMLRLRILAALAAFPQAATAEQDAWRLQAVLLAADAESAEAAQLVAPMLELLRGADLADEDRARLDAAGAKIEALISR
jgi:hypothetical protein